jgi:hypothetical protein
MKSNHWVTVGMLLGALGLMIGGLDHWHDAIKPQFVAGVCVAIGSVLKAMKEEGPR